MTCPPARRWRSGGRVGRSASLPNSAVAAIARSCWRWTRGTSSYRDQGCEGGGEGCDAQLSSFTVSIVLWHPYCSKTLFTSYTRKKTLLRTWYLCVLGVRNSEPILRCSLIYGSGSPYRCIALRAIQRQSPGGIQAQAVHFFIQWP